MNLKVNFQSIKGIDKRLLMQHIAEIMIGLVQMKNGKNKRCYFVCS